MRLQKYSDPVTPPHCTSENSVKSPYDYCEALFAASLSVEENPLIWAQLKQNKMFRRFYEFLLIYFLATDIVFSNDYESLKARIDTIERQLNEGSTKLEAFTGYFFLDRRIISLIKPKCHNWLSFDLHIFYVKLNLKQYHVQNAPSIWQSVFTFWFHWWNNSSTLLKKIICSETIENLETSVNGTKMVQENTNNDVNSLKTKTNDLEEITNVLSVEESCQQLSNLGTVYLLGQ